MVSVGSKALPSRTRRIHNFIEEYLMGEEGQLYKHGRRKKGLSRKHQNKSYGVDSGKSDKDVSGHRVGKSHESMKKEDVSLSQPSIVRYLISPVIANQGNSILLQLMNKRNLLLLYLFIYLFQ